jgi:predicted RNA-binding Zn ribbon-like protein
MPVTLGREDVTSQQPFDSYVGELAGLTLRLINDVATRYAHGSKVLGPKSSDDELKRINDAFSADREEWGLRCWSPVGQAEAAALVAAIRRMRAAVDAAIDGDIHVAAQILNALLSEYQAVPNLHGAPGQAPVLAFHSVEATPMTARVAEMTTSLAMIIGTGRVRRLGRCEASKCDRVFYDTSRNGSRRYCDLSCQNRAKASAFRARRASG